MDKSGKKGKGLFKKEAKRNYWFSNDGTTLYYGKVHDAPKKKGIPLAGLKVEKKDPKKAKKNASKFWIHLDTTDKKSKKNLRDFACTSPEEREKLIQALTMSPKATVDKPIEKVQVIETSTPESSTSTHDATTSGTSSARTSTSQSHSQSTSHSSTSEFTHSATESGTQDSAESGTQSIEHSGTNSGTSETGTSETGTQSGTESSAGTEESGSEGSTEGTTSA